MERKDKVTVTDPKQMADGCSDMLIKGCNNILMRFMEYAAIMVIGWYGMHLMGFNADIVKYIGASFILEAFISFVKLSWKG